MNSTQPLGQAAGVEPVERKWYKRRPTRLGIETTTGVILFGCVAVVAIGAGNNWLNVAACAAIQLVCRRYHITRAAVAYDKWANCSCIAPSYRRRAWRHMSYLLAIFIGSAAFDWGLWLGFEGLLMFGGLFFGAQIWFNWRAESFVKNLMLAHHVYSVLKLFPHAIPVAAVYPGPPVTTLRMRIVLSRLALNRVIEVFSAGDTWYIRLLPEGSAHG